MILSCSSSKWTGNPESIPVYELKRNINKNSELIRTCEAYGNISFDSPDMSNTGFIEVKFKQDSLYIKLEGPFGLDIAKVLITPLNFIYYNVQENKVITGPSTETHINAILKIKLGFEDLKNTFFCSFIFAEEPNDSSEAPTGDNLYMYSINRESGKQNFYIMPANYKINRYNITGKTGLLLEVKYSGFNNTDNIIFPSQIKIKKPSDKQTVWINYETIELNNSEIKLQMRYPKSAKVIKWE
jgi:hypothetical protein